MVTVEQPATIIDYSPARPGRLVAALGAKQVTLADNVTAFLWGPSGR